MTNCSHNLLSILPDNEALNSLLNYSFASSYVATFYTTQLNNNTTKKPLGLSHSSGLAVVLFCLLICLCTGNINLDIKSS